MKQEPVPPSVWLLCHLCRPQRSWLLLALLAAVAAGAGPRPTLVAELQAVNGAAASPLAPQAMDMQSMRGFFAEHEAALEENKLLEHEIARFTSQVESLSQQLTIVRNQTAQEGATAAADDRGLLRRRLMNKSDADLEETNARLQEQNAKASAVVQTILQELDSAKADLVKRRNTTKVLEAQVLQHHSYAEQCQRKALQYEERLAAYDRLKASIRGHGSHAQKIADENEQVHHLLMMKNAKIKVRLQKARANAATVQAQVLRTRAEQEQLEQEGQAELARMRGELGRLRAKEEEAKAELQAKVLSRTAAQKDLERAEADVQRLQQQLLSGELAKLESNNTQLKADLLQAQQTVQMSQASIMKFEGQIVQANETVASLKNATEESLLRAQEVARESLEEVEAAKARDEAAAARAKQATMKAEAQLLEDCNATWDKRHPEILEEFERCEPLLLELKTLRAQVEALSNAISASSTQESIED